jgi:protoheme IX farnesyltransferase
MNSTLSRLDGFEPLQRGGLRGTINDYYELTKPRIINLLLITTLASMVMAARGLPPLWITLWTLIGGALAAGSAGAFNAVIDRDVDPLMRRTQTRPVASGRISPRSAAIFAVLTGVFSFALLYALVNPLAAWLSLFGNFYYVVIYSLLLKRNTAWNIVVGGAAGSVPPLVGWAAVAGTIGWPAVALALAVFLWTPPHFWALALMANTDYTKAKIPMLPAVRGIGRTKNEILIYSLVLAAASLAFVPLGVFGLWYLGAAIVLSAGLIVNAVAILRGPTQPASREMFTFSLVYLALLCGAMVADRLI